MEGAFLNVLAVFGTTAVIFACTLLWKLTGDVRILKYEMKKHGSVTGRMEMGMGQIEARLDRIERRQGGRDVIE